MNIQTQCCGIVLLLVLLIFYLRRRKLHLATERAFLFIFIATFICIILDVVSVICITYNESIPPKLLEFICKSYPASVIWVALSCLYYVCTEIYIDRKHKVWFARICGVSTVFGMAFVYILPIKYRYEPDKDILYSYGPSVQLTYVLTLLLLLTAIAIMRYYKKRINANRRKAVYIWINVWIIAAVVQFLNNNLLLVGYAGALGVMILYLKLENPDNNLDRKTGTFNQNSFARYIRHLYSKGKKFSLFSIVFDQSDVQNMLSDIKGADILKISEYLLSFPEANVFRWNQEEFTIIFTNPANAIGQAKIIEEYLVKEWRKKENIKTRPEMFFLEDSSVLDNSDDLFYLIRYIRQEEHEYTDELITKIDKSVVDKMFNEKNMKSLLLDAMESDRVEVYYQPIYSVAEKHFTSAEALVRIKDENGRIVPPGAFIAVAEKSGMILRLGEIVFRKVCRFIKENRIEQYGLHYIEINLSVVQCADEQLANTYIKIMEEFEINPKWINLEITESASLSAKKILLDNMKCLMNYGVRFSLDDFGTGQSNLNYIVDMPVDIVKFDRDMINSYFENVKAKYVMNAAMNMIQGMKLQIVSEGIETEKQYDTMEELGINYIQGYYFSKPLPQDEFIKFLEEKNVF